MMSKLIKNLNDINLINIIINSFDIKTLQRYAFIDFGVNIEKNEIFTNSNPNIFFLQEIIQGRSGETVTISLNYRNLNPSLALIDTLTIGTGGDHYNQMFVFNLINASVPFVNTGSRLQFFGYKFEIE